MISDAFSYDSSSIVVLDDGEVNEATCYEMNESLWLLKRLVNKFVLTLT